MKNIDVMYQLYGKVEDKKCGDCCNFVCQQYGRISLLKCRAYGVTHSESTDWRKKRTACGMFDVPFDENEQKRGMDVAAAAKHPADLSPLDGQLKLDV